MKEIIEYLKARYMTEKAQGMVEYSMLIAFIVAVAVLVFGIGNGQPGSTDGDFTAAVKAGFTKAKDAIK